MARPSICAALQTHGACLTHRRSFAPVARALASLAGTGTPVMSNPAVITSRDNPLLKELRRLAQDNTAYRKQGRVWLEGDHLCRAALARGIDLPMAVFTAISWPLAPRELRAGSYENIVILPTPLMATSAGWNRRRAWVLCWICRQPPALDRPGHRGAGPGAGRRQRGLHPAQRGAFGFRQVLALKGTAALWSPKVLRAGMGAHFGLRLVEGWSRRSGHTGRAVAGDQLAPG